MLPDVSSQDPRAVGAEVQTAYLAMFPQGDPLFVSRVLGWTLDCFAGRYADYGPVDTRYHDLEHTLQGTLCMVRLLRRRQETGAEPRLTQRMFELGLLAILLHDTGYLKARHDTQGTGAKYTIIHVQRSAAFAQRLLTEKGFASEEFFAVQNMIRCTGVDAALSVIPFQSELERVVGHALGTGDLLGQMAAADYVEKLPILYAEFAEALAFSRQKTSFVALFSSALDLMQKTPTFWEKIVRPKLERDFGGLYRFLNDPYPHGPNAYVDRIEANIEKLRRQLALMSPRTPS